MLTNHSNAQASETHVIPGTPDYVSRGGVFGDYVRRVVFPVHKYTIIGEPGQPVDPQYKMVCHEMDREFYLETRFLRKATIDTYKIQWCLQSEFEHYKQMEKDGKVFLALGVGEDPANPSQLYIIPLSSIHFSSFYETFLDKYAFYPGKPVFNGALWRIN